MSKKKTTALPPRRYGPPPGTRLKPPGECVTEGRRVSLYLLPADYGRLAGEAQRRQLPITVLVRGMIINALSGPTS